MSQKNFSKTSLKALDIRVPACYNKYRKAKETKTMTKILVHVSKVEMYLNYLIHNDYDFTWKKENSGYYLFKINF